MVTATGLNQEIILEFDSETGDNADLFNYDVENPFAPVDAVDRTYTFEGFLVYQYRSLADSEGILVGSYDLDNGITNIIDTVIDPSTGIPLTQVIVTGADNGDGLTTPTSISFNSDGFTQQPLRNGTSYYYGVQAYAYNESSIGSRVFRGPLTRVEVRPTLVGATVPVATTGSDLPSVAAASNVGGGLVGARVVNPGATTGASYNVVFFTQNDEDGNAVGTNYRIINTTTNTTLFDGAAYYAATGTLAPQRTDAFRGEGLAFDVQGPDPGPLFPGGTNAFVEITGPGGVDACGPGAASTGGCSLGTGNNIYSSFNSTSDYVGSRVGAGPEDSIGGFAPNEFEIRFTDEGSYGYYGFTTGNLIKVPFEVWDIGLTPPGRANDPSDDVQMVPVLFADGPIECEFGLQLGRGRVALRDR